MADRRHFVDEHRAALISRVSLVEPILHDLLSEDLLTQEQYDIVRSAATSQEKLRRLYGFVRSWGNADKNKFYLALKRSHGPLIRDLEDSEQLPDDFNWNDSRKTKGTQRTQRDLKDYKREQKEAPGLEPDTADMPTSSRAQDGGAERKRPQPPTYLTDALTCCICTNIYRDPVTLPCGHAYCKECMNKTWKYELFVNREVACPECRVVHKKPPALEKSWRLCELVEAHQLHMEDAPNQE